MGGGNYSSSRYSSTLKSKGISDSTDNNEIFKNRSINNAMSPFGVKVRESRDSAEHPNSLAIIIALDLTGSMGSIPNYLVKYGLPNIMQSIIDNGIKDPQIMFLGIGDHECDTAPLQVSQFESSDELLSKWLTTVYLEGGGGGNAGESYLLAWYFAAMHTSLDCWEKRKQKGYLFTIGDEPTLEEVPSNYLKNIMGDGQYENFKANKLYEKASEIYNVFHIHVKETTSGSRKLVSDGWKQLISDNLIITNRHEEIATLISGRIKQSNVQIVSEGLPILSVDEHLR